MARRKKTPGKVKVDLSEVGKSFKPNETYLVAVEEATMEEGTKAPYIKLKMKGTEDFAGSVIYDNISMAPGAAWKLPDILEAFEVEVPEDGQLELGPDDFADKEVMVETFLDKWDGGTSVKVASYLSPDAGDDEDEEEPEKETSKKGGKKKEEPEEEEAGEVDLDSVSDADIKKLAKELDIKGRGVAALRKKLAEVDEEELVEAAEELDIELGAGEEESSDDPTSITEEEVSGMSEEELEELIEQEELDVKLSKFKTLRKKRNAVIDAAEEAGILERDG